MAGSVNKVILVGNVGKDPEGRDLQTGRVVSFSLATSESWTDKNTNERKEKTQWHRIVIWNDKIGEIAERYLKKGSKVYIEGSLESRKYTDKDGVEREISEVVVQRFRGELTLLGDPQGGQGGEQRAPARSQQRAPATTGQGAAGQHRGQGASWENSSDLDDEIPF